MTTTTEQTITSDRAATIAQIRTDLRRRSGKAWSVKGGTGTAWGWIRVSAPPARCGQFGIMTIEDQTELGELLALGRAAHHQGENIPASGTYRAEYLARAAGEPVETRGTPYWD